MAEQRLIDANALIYWLTKATGFRTNCEDCTSIDCLECIIDEAIKNAPTIEAKSVVHGHWISKNHHGYEWVFVCSNCDYIDGYPFNDRPNYCPNCGARMDEPIEENDK